MRIKGLLIVEKNPLCLFFYFSHVWIVTESSTFRTTTAATSVSQWTFQAAVHSDIRLLSIERESTKKQEKNDYSIGEEANEKWEWGSILLIVKWKRGEKFKLKKNITKHKMIFFFIIAEWSEIVVTILRGAGNEIKNCWFESDKLQLQHSIRVSLSLESFIWLTFHNRNEYLYIAQHHERSEGKIDTTTIIFYKKKYKDIHLLLYIIYKIFILLSFSAITAWLVLTHVHIHFLVWQHKLIL